MSEIEALASVAEAVAGESDEGFRYLPRAEARKVVRAILTAMREPTMAMYQAGFLAGQCEVTAGLTYSEYTSDPAELGSDAPNVIWQAMIDHILNEESK